MPDYEPWDKELLEVIFDNNKNLINKFYSLSDEELNNSIMNKLSKNDEKILDLISYTHHPVPLSNETKDKDDQINLQFMLIKKREKKFKKNISRTKKERYSRKNKIRFD